MSLSTLSPSILAPGDVQIAAPRPRHHTIGVRVGDGLVVLPFVCNP